MSRNSNWYDIECTWWRLSTPSRFAILTAGAKELYSIPQCVELVGHLSHMTIYRAVEAGELPTIIIGKYAYVLLEQLENWHNAKYPNHAMVMKERVKQCKL